MDLKRDKTAAKSWENDCLKKVEYYDHRWPDDRDHGSTEQLQQNSNDFCSHIKKYDFDIAPKVEKRTRAGIKCRAEETQTSLYCFTEIRPSWTDVFLCLSNWSAVWPSQGSLWCDRNWKGGGVAVRVPVLALVKVHRSTLFRIKTKSVPLRHRF